MADIIKPPTLFYSKEIFDSIFLAGSIEMGVAEQWQAKVEKAFADVNCTIFNPRRDDWDSSWVQTKDNPQFREQVEWELSAMTTADIIPVYFDPTTKSPITLLELGLFHDKMIVCCPEGFWRKGNVDIVCEWFNVRQATTLQSLIDMTITAMDKRLYVA